MKLQNNIRIIGRLDVKGPNLVKGIKLEGLRHLVNLIHLPNTTMKII